MNTSLDYAYRHQKCLLKDKETEVQHLKESLLACKVAAQWDGKRLENESSGNRWKTDGLNRRIEQLEACKEDLEKQLSEQTVKTQEALTRAQTAHSLVRQHLANATKSKEEVDGLQNQCRKLNDQCRCLEDQLEDSRKQFENWTKSRVEEKDMWEKESSSLSTQLKDLQERLDVEVDAKMKIENVNGDLTTRNEELSRSLEEAMTILDVAKSESFTQTNSSMINAKDIEIQASPEQSSTTVQTFDVAKSSDFTQTPHTILSSTTTQTNPILHLSKFTNTVTHGMFQNVSEHTLHVPDARGNRKSNYSETDKGWFPLRPRSVISSSEHLSSGQAVSSSTHNHNSIFPVPMPTPDNNDITTQNNCNIHSKKTDSSFSPLYTTSSSSPNTNESDIVFLNSSSKTENSRLMNRANTVSNVNNKPCPYRAESKTYSNTSAVTNGDLSDQVDALNNGNRNDLSDCNNKPNLHKDEACIGLIVSSKSLNGSDYFNPLTNHNVNNSTSNNKDPSNSSTNPSIFDPCPVSHPKETPKIEKQEQTPTNTTGLSWLSMSVLSPKTSIPDSCETHAGEGITQNPLKSFLLKNDYYNSNQNPSRNGIDMSSNNEPNSLTRDKTKHIYSDKHAGLWGETQSLPQTNQGALVHSADASLVLPTGDSKLYTDVNGNHFATNTTANIFSNSTITTNCRTSDYQLGKTSANCNVISTDRNIANNTMTNTTSNYNSNANAIQHKDCSNAFQTDSNIKKESTLIESVFDSTNNCPFSNGSSSSITATQKPSPIGKLSLKHVGKLNPIFTTPEQQSSSVSSSAAAAAVSSTSSSLYMMTTNQPTVTNDNAVPPSPPPPPPHIPSVTKMMDKIRLEKKKRQYHKRLLFTPLVDKPMGVNTTDIGNGSQSQSTHTQKMDQNNVIDKKDDRNKDPTGLSTCDKADDEASSAVVNDAVSKDIRGILKVPSKRKSCDFTAKTVSFSSHIDSASQNAKENPKRWVSSSLWSCIGDDNDPQSANTTAVMTTATLNSSTLTRTTEDIKDNVASVKPSTVDARPDPVLSPVNLVVIPDSPEETMCTQGGGLDTDGGGDNSHHLVDGLTEISGMDLGTGGE